MDTTRRGHADARLRAPPEAIEGLVAEHQAAWVRVDDVHGLCASTIEPLQDTFHVLARLRIWRDPSILDHRSLAGVIRGQGERHVVLEPVHRSEERRVGEEW